MTDKYPGESVNLTSTFKNTGNHTCTFYFGASIMDPGGVIQDLVIQSVSIAQNASSTKSWTLTLPQGVVVGNYQARFTVWDVSPSGSCEADGTCHRLADSNWVTGFTVLATPVCSAQITAYSIT